MTPEDLTAARQYARAYARWRCGGQTGRGKLDPVYVEETEGRDQKAFWDHYSSCGDLSQGLAYHLGVRKPYVNRAAMPGGWHPGRNLLHFYDPARGSASYPALGAYCAEHDPPAIHVPADYVPQAGDLGFIWTPGNNNAHTFVFGNVLAFAANAGNTPATAPSLVVETFNYGAGGMARTEFPGAHCSDSHVERRNGGLWFGTRRLQYVVPLERLLADSDGLPDMSGEAIDEMEGRVP